MLSKKTLPARRRSIAALNSASKPIIENLENRRLLSASPALHTTFGFNSSTDDLATASTRDASGRTIIAGNQAGTGDIVLARFLSSGQLDATFGVAGLATVDLGGNDAVGDIALDQFGNIFLAGSKDSALTVAKLTPTGALDSSFNGSGVSTLDLGTGASSAATSIIVTPAGEVFAGGSSFDGARNSFIVAKFNPQGTPDASFGANGAAIDPIADDSQVADILLTNDGAIIAGGQSFDASSFQSSFTVARFNASGQNEWNQTTPFAFDSHIVSLADNAGQLLAIGEAGGLAFAQYDITSGAPDPSFNAGQSTFVDSQITNQISIIKADVVSGKIVVAGTQLDTPATRLATVSYSQAGGFVASPIFSTDLNDPATNHTLNSAVFNANGSVTLVGTATAPGQGVNFGAATISSTGIASPAFTADFSAGAFDQGAAVAVDSTGRYLVAATTTSLTTPSTKSALLIRRTPTGAPDLTFGLSGVVTVSALQSIQSIAVDPAGNILLAGITPAGQAAIVRYTPAGLLDNTFNATGVRVIAPSADQPSNQTIRLALDGPNIIVTGSTNTGASDDIFVARVAPTGTLQFLTTVDAQTLLDPNTATPSNDLASALLILPDHSIIVGGSTDLSLVNNDFALIKFTPAGAVDANFGTSGLATLDIASGNDTVTGLALQPSGNIIAAGSADNSIALARFTPAGAPDLSFANAGKRLFNDLSTSTGAQSLATDSTGRLILTATLAGPSEDFLVLRLNPDATPDTTFTPTGVATYDFAGQSDNPAAAIVTPNDGIVVIGSANVSPTNRDIALLAYAGVAAPVNTPPVVTPITGPITGLTNTTLNYSASFTDPNDAGPHTQTWTVTNSASQTIATGTGPNFSFTPTTPGAFTITYTVTDSGSLSDSSSLVVNITVPNTAPVANPITGPTASNTGAAVNYTATYSDPGDAAPHAETWTVTNNLNAIVATGTGPAFSFTPATPGTYAITYTVTDSGNLTSSSTLSLTVTTPNVAPVASPIVGPTTGLTNTPLTFTGAYTDPGDLAPHTQTWSITNTANQVVATGAGPSFTWTPTVAGTFTVKFTVTDSGSLFSSTTLVVAVNNPNVAPIANPIVGPATGAPNTPLNFSGSFTDPGDLAPHTLTWTVTNSANQTIATGAGPTFTWTPTTSGVFTVTFTVTDSGNLTSSSSLPVTITSANVAPVVAPVAGATTGVSLFAQTFTGSYTDPGDASAHTQTWTVTNAANQIVATSTGASFTWTPQSAGAFTVTFTVTDGGGLSASSSSNVVVSSAGVSAGVLQIGADSAPNTIRVSLANGVYRIDIDNKPTQLIPAGSIASLLIKGGDGDDNIVLGASVNIPAEIHGGAGNDIIAGGNGDDILFGESGNDILLGRAGDDVFVGGDGTDFLAGGTGRDVLIGGLGSDIIQGDQADDILIAGTTSHDTSPSELSAIRTLWNGGGNYTTRVNSLRSTLLRPDLDVFDDHAVDILSGNEGTDWFIDNTDGTAIDIITDLNAKKEIVSDVD